MAMAESPDVILLDLSMPEMDGFEVCSVIKKDDQLKRIPVIVLTALRTDSLSRVKILSLGAEAFLSKPIDRTELVAQVSSMARMKQSEDVVRTEKALLETVVAERTRELSAELAKREKTEHELKALIRELDESREAAFNLTEDLIAENKDRRLAEENVLKLNEDLEKRVLERTAQLDEANKELESFSYSVSHDLQAPLRHINGFADMLASDYKEQLPEEAQHFLDTIMRNAKMMSLLIDGLLDFSRNSRKELEATAFDMGKVVEAARLQIVEMSKKNNISWNVSELLTVNADYNLIMMVWMNLISNAVKYSGERSLAIIDIGCFEIESAVIFYIRDNGIGFDMKYAQNLFGVFQRLHSSKGYEGTGIGLANVRKIIIRHGGKIWAKSEPDKGACFYFSLPKANSLS